MIDTQGIQDFEGGFAALLDAVDELRALSVPTERDGVKGIVKWHDEVKKILARIPDLPDTSPLTEFAEAVERAVAALEEAAQAALAGAREKSHPRDEGLLPPDERFWGEVVSEVGSGKYTFKEKVRSDATTWADKTGGRTGDCYEANDVTGIAVGTIIKIRVEYDATGTLRYVFDSTVSIEAGTADGDILVWDQTTDKAWEKTVPTEVTVVTAVQVTGVTLQKKTRTLKVVSAGAESGWTTFHTGTECP
ncbi:hypothetical protein ES708_21313 [subsurface metagenome]